MGLDLIFGVRMSDKNEICRSDVDEFAFQSELANRLNDQLDDAHRRAQERSENGQRSGGFVAVVRYFVTFLLTGLLEGKIQRGRQGLVDCAVAAQDAYNRDAMTYGMAVRKK